VRTAQVNVDFARTHFGAEAVPGADEALEQTRAELARAFTIRQELDDEIPEDEPTQRRMLTELLALTDSAGKRLAEQSAALDALRAQEANAPQAIEELGARIAELQARSTATTTIDSTAHAPVAAIQTQKFRRRIRSRTSARNPSAASRVDSTRRPAIQARFT